MARLERREHERILKDILQWARALGISEAYDEELAQVAELQRATVLGAVWSLLDGRAEPAVLGRLLAEQQEAALRSVFKRMVSP